MLFRLIFFLSLPLFVYSEIGYVEPWGKDAKLKVEKQVQETLPQKRLSPMGFFAEKMILFHHQVLTHVDGTRSHFRPSSSTYMLEAIRKHGFFKGYIMGCDRLLRENSDPWIYPKTLDEGKLFKWDPPH